MDITLSIFRSKLRVRDWENNFCVSQPNCIMFGLKLKVLIWKVQKTYFWQFPYIIVTKKKTLSIYRHKKLTPAGQLLFFSPKPCHVTYQMKGLGMRNKRNVLLGTYLLTITKKWKFLLAQWLRHQPVIRRLRVWIAVRTKICIVSIRLQFPPSSTKFRMVIAEDVITLYMSESWSV